MLLEVIEVAAVVIHDAKTSFGTGIKLNTYSCESCLVKLADGTCSSRWGQIWRGRLEISYSLDGCPSLANALCRTAYLPRQLTAMYSSTFTQQFDVPKLP